MSLPTRPNLSTTLPEHAAGFNMGLAWESPAAAMADAIMRSFLYEGRALFYYDSEKLRGATIPGFSRPLSSPAPHPRFMVEALSGYHGIGPEYRWEQLMGLAAVVVNRLLHSDHAAYLPNVPVLVWRNKDTGAVQVRTHAEGRPVGPNGGKSSRWVRIASIVPVPQEAVKQPEPLPVTQVSPEVFNALTSAIEKHGTPRGRDLKVLSVSPENLEKVREELRQASQRDFEGEARRAGKSPTANEVSLAMFGPSDGSGPSTEDRAHAAPDLRGHHWSFGG